MAKNLGFTLIEIVVASAVFAAVSIPIFYVFGSSQRNLQMAESEFRAHNAAIEIMEQIISMPFQYIEAGIYEKDNVKNGEPIGNTEFKFKRSSDLPTKIVIDNISKDGKILFKKISVAVEYMPANGAKEPKSAIIKTMVANELNL